MKQALIKRNYYRQVNTDRMARLAGLYECLCNVAYDPKREHKCWVEFIKKIGYSLNIDVLATKERVDKKMEYLSGYIERALDKNKEE